MDMPVHLQQLSAQVSAVGESASGEVAIVFTHASFPQELASLSLSGIHMWWCSVGAYSVGIKADGYHTDNYDEDSVPVTVMVLHIVDALFMVVCLTLA
eukprot:gene12530-14806_t